jgi:hypothetical protein
MNTEAVVSSCGLYRYYLRRQWDESLLLMFVVMLNPSTADATNDDATIRKLMGFARRLGFGGVVVCNVYAFRATAPGNMRKAADPIGPDNDKWLQRIAMFAKREAVPVVCAWGANMRDDPRAMDVCALLKSQGATLAAFSFTSDGIPRHPLMLPYSCTLQAF